MAGSFLSCRACLLRTLQITAANAGAAESSALRTAAHLGQRSRTYTTATAVPIDAPRTLQVPNEDQSVVEKKQRERLQRAVKKHLDYMDDPWKIAQHIEQTLAKDRFDEALLLTQKASKDSQVVVAWNHLIGYQLEQQQLKKAIKLFNEVRFSWP